MYFWSSPWVSIMQSGLRLWPSHLCAIPRGPGAGAPQGTAHFLCGRGPCGSGHGSSQHTLEPPNNSYVKTLPLGSFRPLFPDSLPLCWGTSDYWWGTLALPSEDSSYGSHLLRGFNHLTAIIVTLRTAPESPPPSQTSFLNSRPGDPIAHHIFPLGYLIGASPKTCPQMELILCCPKPFLPSFFCVKWHQLSSVLQPHKPKLWDLPHAFPFLLQPTPNSLCFC